ncbi:MAG TPA: MFS transporter [Acidimicrobiales bacterium]
MTLLTQAPTLTPTRRTSREVLIIVCAGMVLASLDLFIVNVALPQIARDFHTSDLSQLSWILNGYAIVYAALLVFFGRLADRYRRDHGFLVGVAVFTAASIACAASSGIWMLVAFRLVQAAGAALLTPTSLGLILATTEPERRASSVRAWTAVAGLAGALGPVIGGLLVAASWRWVFLINVPIGVAALIVGWRRLPHVPGHPTTRPSPPGVILACAGTALLTTALVKGTDWGWHSAALIGTASGAVVLIGAFVAHCLYSTRPLIDPKMFQSRAFLGASIIAMIYSAAFAAMLLSIVLWEQGPWGWSPLRSALGLAPGPLMVPIVSFGLTSRALARFGPARVISFGCAIFGSGLAWWALAVHLKPNYGTGVLGGLLVCGVGVGLTLPSIMSTGVGALPPQSFATGSGAINMLRQSGLALGVAVLIAVLGSAHHGTAALTRFRHGWWVAAAIAFCAVIPATALLGRKLSNAAG